MTHAQMKAQSGVAYLLMGALSTAVSGAPVNVNSELTSGAHCTLRCQKGSGSMMKGRSIKWAQAHHSTYHRRMACT
jgi:hypothetical protein